MHAPLVRTVSSDVDASGTGQGQTVVVGESPFDGVVTVVSFTPSAAVVGGTADYTTLKLLNKGAAGAGTTVVASKAFNTASTATAFDEIAFTVDTARDDVTSGDILELTGTAAGAGLATPAGLVQVEISRG